MGMSICQVQTSSVFLHASAKENAWEFLYERSIQDHSQNSGHLSWMRLLLDHACSFTLDASGAVVTTQEFCVVQNLMSSMRLGFIG
jgi:hypothetical protein